LILNSDSSTNCVKVYETQPHPSTTNFAYFLSQETHLCNLQAPKIYYCRNWSNRNPIFFLFSLINPTVTSLFYQLVLILLHVLLLEILYDPIHPLRKPINFPALSLIIFLTSCIFKFFLCLVLNRLSYYQESENLCSSCQVSVHPGRSTLKKISFISQSYSWEGFKQKNSKTTLFWHGIHTTDLSNAFNSIWNSALFLQLITLDFPLSLCCLYPLLLSDRWAEIIFRVLVITSFGSDAIFSKFLSSV